jgi:hypothetical protein
MDMRIEGRETHFSPLCYQVSPRYLETLGVPLLAGRSLSREDGPEAPLAVVINETAARRFWPDDSPIGATVSLSYPHGPATVVGVVGDVKRQFLYADTEPAFFIPFSQLPDETICFVARTELDPVEVLPLMGAAVRAVDREIVVKNATTMDTIVAESANHERYRTLLMNFFAMLAALLAAAGVFGVTARAVALGKREMGIRMALGARPPLLIVTTMRRTLLTCLAGTAVGLLAALWTSGVLAHFLFGIASSDPFTYGVVAGLLTILCLLASYTPARRISRVNPVDVLRAE